MIRIVTLCAFLLAASVPAAAVGPVTELPADARLVEVGQLVVSAEQQRRADRWTAMLAAGDSAAVIAEGEAMHDPLGFELVAARVVDALRTMPPGMAGKRWLEWLATQPPRVWRRHDETAADAFVPVFALDGRAAGTLELWQRNDLRTAWIERFERAPGQAVAKAGDAGDVEQAAAADAIAMLDAAALPALAASLLQHEAPAGLLLALAERRPDQAVLARVIANGSQPQQLAAIALASRLAADHAFKLLVQASAEPALASAATLALSDIAPRHPPAMQLLVARLDDGVLGSSAAAALSRLPADDRVATIGALLTADAGATRAAHLVLALRLEGSPAARRMLDRWRDDPRVPAKIRQALGR